MANDSERMQILEMIESGKITPAEGLALLNALNGAGTALSEEASLSGEAPGGGDEGGEAGLPVPPPAPAEPAPPALERQAEDWSWEPGEGARAYPTLEKPEILGETALTQADYAPEVAAPQAGAFEQEPFPEGEAGAPPARGEVIPPPAIGPDFSRWRRFWEIPLWVGVGITVLSGFLMLLAWQGSGFGFWFACTWLPFLMGVAVIALAWSTRNLPWLHIRVQQKPGERPQHINISLPLPLGVIGWALRTFKHKIPGTGNVNLDEMVMALKHVSPEAPFSVDVEEGEDGERVQIYIG